MTKINKAVTLKLLTLLLILIVFATGFSYIHGNVIDAYDKGEKAECVNYNANEFIRQSLAREHEVGAENDQDDRARRDHQQLVRFQAASLGVSCEANGIARSNVRSAGVAFIAGLLAICLTAVSMLYNAIVQEKAAVSGAGKSLLPIAIEADFGDAGNGVRPRWTARNVGNSPIVVEGRGAFILASAADLVAEIGKARLDDVTTRLPLGGEVTINPLGDPQGKDETCLIVLRYRTDDGERALAWAAFRSFGTPASQNKHAEGKIKI